METAARILIVEDEIIVAKNIQKKLENLGYSVPDIAAAGEVAIRIARDTTPDLVLMDIKLEGEMDGIEAAAQIRAKYDIPVVYLTAYADEDTLQRARITEPFGYVLKPITIRELVANIEMALYKHQMERQLKESRQWFVTTLTCIGEGVIATDVSGHIVFMNPVAEALTGWKQEHGLRKEAVDVLYLKEAETDLPIESPIVRALRENVNVDLLSHDIVLVSSEGTDIPIEMSVSPIKDDLEIVTGAVAVFRDITEQKQAEEEIRRRNYELAFFNRIVAASVAGLEPELILDMACRELALACDVPQTIASLINEKKTEIEVVAEYTIVDIPPSLHRISSLADNSVFRFLFSDKVPLVSEDVQNDPRLTSLKNMMQQEGITSLLILPLISGDEVLGSLELRSLEPRLFSDREVNLAWSVSNEVAGALFRAQLAQTHRRLITAIEQSAESVIITDTSGIILYVNPTFETDTGYSPTEVVGLNINILKSGKHDSAFYGELWATINSGQMWHGRFINKKKDGTHYSAEATISPVRDERGALVNYVSAQRDVTRELELEEQYRQAQKMDAIGQLTAGIAHDFNNLLTAINGYAQLMQFKLEPDDPLREMAGQIRNSGNRAADLIRQLLTFSRKQVIEPEVLSLNSIVEEMDKMLRRIIGEQIIIETRLSRDLWLLKIDSTQVEQIIINLAVNARDAMIDGGGLTFETANIVLDNDYVGRHLGAQLGRHIQLTVSDTGIGMSEEVQARIFEPFFTTKDPGKGTGLGLATVFGIVKQNGGHIRVESVENLGTTFKVILPAVEEEDNQFQNQPDQADDLPYGTETVLLIEDEQVVRDLVANTLRQQGYNVLEASDGKEALSLIRIHGEEIELMLTDVVIPQMDGKALADQLETISPTSRILFTSGYLGEAIAHRGVLDRGVAFLPKPFSPATLIRKVRAVLDAT